MPLTPSSSSPPPSSLFPLLPRTCPCCLESSRSSAERGRPASPLKMDGSGLEWKPASRIMSFFFCNQYSQKRRCFKRKQLFFFFLVRRLDRKCCRSGSCRNDAAPYYCAKYPGIIVPNIPGFCIICVPTSTSSQITSYQTWLSRQTSTNYTFLISQSSH